MPARWTRRFGRDELHGAFLRHRDDQGGNAPSVVVLIPEGEDCFDAAVEQAGLFRARVAFLCDTADQAAAALERARRALRKHRPVNIERAAAGGWGLS